MTSLQADQQVNHSHSVQFYESDDFLAQSAVLFLDDGGSAIVIATPDYLAAFHAGLRTAQIPTEACNVHTHVLPRET